MAMLIVATTVFLYYTLWTLFMVREPLVNAWQYTDNGQPFVDDDHPLQGLFPPRVWAIRIPVILTLLASTVVGSFLAMVMIRSNKKKAAKAKAAAAKKSK
jgi:dolichol phosphate-mannose biosynthesis regulatory protein